MESDGAGAEGGLWKGGSGRGVAVGLLLLLLLVGVGILTSIVVICRCLLPALFAAFSAIFVGGIVVGILFVACAEGLCVLTPFVFAHGNDALQEVARLKLRRRALRFGAGAGDGVLKNSHNSPPHMVVGAEGAQKRRLFLCCKGSTPAPRDECIEE